MRIQINVNLVFSFVFLLRQQKNERIRNFKNQTAFFMNIVDIDRMDDNYLFQFFSIGSYLVFYVGQANRKIEN
jgi:hypothetical protein